MPEQQKPFHVLFQEHLARGSRADQRADDPSWRKWKHADFAAQIGVDQRTVTNWKNGSRTPLKAELDKIVALLFGDNPMHETAKTEFIAAWTARDGQRGVPGRTAGSPPLPARRTGSARPRFGWPGNHAAAQEVASVGSMSATPTCAEPDRPTPTSCRRSHRRGRPLTSVRTTTRPGRRHIPVPPPIAVCANSMSPRGHAPRSAHGGRSAHRRERQLCRLAPTWRTPLTPRCKRGAPCTPR